jgi:hypothetical protein
MLHREPVLFIGLNVDVLHRERPLCVRVNVDMFQQKTLCLCSS